MKPRAGPGGPGKTGTGVVSVTQRWRTNDGTRTVGAKSDTICLWWADAKEGMLLKMQRRRTFNGQWQRGRNWRAARVGPAFRKEQLWGSSNGRGSRSPSEGKSD